LPTLIFACQVTDCGAVLGLAIAQAPLSENASKIITFWRIENYLSRLLIPRRLRERFPVGFWAGGPDSLERRFSRLGAAPEGLAMEQLEFLLSGPVKSSKVRADTIASDGFGDRREPKPKTRPQKPRTGHPPHS
jgi:hypothetical protein